MNIIEAKIEHLNSVYELICELENEKLNKENFTQIYQDNINNKDVHYLLAFDNLNIVGFASLHIQQLLHHCTKIGEIQEIVVSKKLQSSGVGTMLFNQIKELAILHNCLQLEVCCNLTREKSHQFYLKQGMSKSHYKFTYKLNDVV